MGEVKWGNQHKAVLDVLFIRGDNNLPFGSSQVCVAVLSSVWPESHMAHEAD